MTGQRESEDDTRIGGRPSGLPPRPDASVRVEPCISMRCPQQRHCCRNARFCEVLHILSVFCITILMTSSRNVGVLGASGYAGAELLRLLARHPDLDVAWAAGDQAAGQPLALPLPGPARRLRRARLLLGRRGPGEGRRRAVLRPAPRPGGRARPAGAGRGRAGRRPLGRLPAARPGCLPRLVRGGAPVPRPARGLALRPARAAPRGAAGRRPGGRARLLPDRGPAGPGPAGRRRAGRDRRDRGRRQVGAVGGRPLAGRRQPVRPGQRERQPVQGGEPPPHPRDRAGAGPGRRRRRSR